MIEERYRAPYIPENPSKYIELLGVAVLGLNSITISQLLGRDTLDHIRLEIETKDSILKRAKTLKVKIFEVNDDQRVVLAQITVNPTQEHTQTFNGTGSDIKPYSQQDTESKVEIRFLNRTKDEPDREVILQYKQLVASKDIYTPTYVSVESKYDEANLDRNGIVHNSNYRLKTQQRFTCFATTKKGNIVTPASDLLNNLQLNNRKKLPVEINCEDGRNYIIWSSKMSKFFKHAWKIIAPFIKFDETLFVRGLDDIVKEIQKDTRVKKKKK